MTPTPYCPRCPISCTRIVGAKRRRALAGQTPVGMLDRAAILLAPHPSFIVCVRPHSRGRLAVVGRQAFKAGADGAVFGIWGFCAQTARAGLESTTAFGDAPSGTAHVTRVVVLPRLFPVCLGAYGTHPLLLLVHRRPGPWSSAAPKSLPGPSGRLNTATIPRCWSPEPTPNGTNRRAGKLLEM